MEHEKVSKIRKAIALLSSMVEGGESHSDESRLAVKEALEALDNYPLMSQPHPRDAIANAIHAVKNHGDNQLLVDAVILLECAEEKVIKHSILTGFGKSINNHVIGAYNERRMRLY